MMKRYIKTLLLCAFFGSVLAQELPQVVLPTPEASSLFKYMDYPVDYSTGLPQIGIPLYSIKAGSIEVPISINYHSSGRKVDAETGAIGLGWTLSAGGMISRTIHGEADDNDAVIKFPVPWLKQTDINTGTLAGSQFLEAVSGSQSSFSFLHYDTEYDVFSFMAPGISGKFVLRDDNNVKVPVLIPKKPYKVAYHQALTQFNIKYYDYISVIDDKGNTYRFGKSMSHESLAYYESSSGVGKSGWMLTEIVSADKADTVYFRYETFSKNKFSISQQTTILDAKRNCATGQLADYEVLTDETGTINEQFYSIQRIKEISWRSGKVVFNLSDDTDLVASIQILTNDELVKTIRFDRSIQDHVTLGNPPTQKLDAIAFIDKTDHEREKYTFEYYPTVFVDGEQTVDARRRDLWGYYNAGSVNMRPYVENIPVQGAITAGTTTIGNPAARVPNESACKSGVLKTIHFPTGGSTEFLYEQNRYSSSSVAGGGLRLYRSITEDAHGQGTIKTYKYGLNEQGWGTIALVPHVSNMMVETKSQSFSNANSPFHLAVEQYRQRVYHADVLPAFSEILNLPIYYGEVTEYQGTETSNIGKTVYKYDLALPTYPANIMNLFSAGVLHWKENSLLEKTDFKNESGVYKRIKGTLNEYLETEYPEEKLWGLKVGKYFFVSPDILVDLSAQPAYSYYLTSDVPTCPEASSYPEIFRFSDYTIHVGKKDLIKTTEVFYENDTPSYSSTTNYAYNSQHLVSSIARTSSSGEELTEESKYPFDFSTLPIHEEMISRNMLNYPVEKLNYSNSTFLMSTKTTYKNWGNSIIKPEIVSSKQGNNEYEDRIKFHSYTQQGNIESVSKDRGPVISYLWDETLSLPVAKIEDALLIKSDETQPTSLQTQSVNVPGLQSEYLFFHNGIVIDFMQDVTLGAVVSKGSPNSQVPDHYYNVTISLFNNETQTEVYNGFFGLTGLSTIEILDLPMGNYSLRYRYLGDIGSDNAFNFYATLDYTRLFKYSNVHYNSFEQDKFNSHAESFTGSKSHVGLYIFKKPKDIGEYRLSYFTKPIGNGEWTYNEQILNITSQQSGDITIGTANILIDEVRLHPIKARMNTYTYEPLIGITSINDPNNLPSRFKYDAYGRLLVVKDSDGNIVKHYKYHYQGEQ